jgi:ribosomal protein S18 acetylase RimI-like enzyme
MPYQSDSTLTDTDKARVKAGFARHTSFHIGCEREAQDWVLRDSEGQCIACLELIVVGQESYIKILWVDEAHRGEGLGKTLMAQAEAYAIDKGHKQIWVDTLSFQAPEFYKGLGYTQIAEVPNYSAGHARIFLSKILENVRI